MNKAIVKKVILGVIGVVVIVVVIAAGWLYFGQFNDAKAKAFRKVSLPMATVGSQVIGSHEFYSRFDLAESLYKSDPGYNSNETKGQVLDQLIDDAKLRMVAADHNIKASQEEIDAQYKAVVDQYSGGSEDQFIQTLNETYHLTPTEFKEKVLTSDILQTNLNVWFNSQKDINKTAYDQLQGLQDKLQQGQAFEDVVKAYTQDEATKDFGGDTGFVKLSELAPEFQKPLQGTKAGDTITVVSRYGLHIVKVVEIDKSGSEPSYHLQQLFVQIGGFEDWYTKQTDAIKSRKLVKFPAAPEAQTNSSNQDNASGTVPENSGTPENAPAK